MTFAPRYAGINRRILAALVDGVFSLVLLVISTLLITVVQPSSGVVKLLMMVWPLLILEPWCLSRYGATLGYFLFSQKVVKEYSGKNLSFFEAFIRYLLKVFLGLFSLIFMFLSQKYQALHDLAVGSLVVAKEASSEHARHFYQERTTLRRYLYPSAQRRALVTVLHCVAAGVLWPLLVFTLLSVLSSFTYFRLSDKASEALTSKGFLIIFLLLVVMGGQGRLWGARRSKAIVSNPPLEDDK